MIDKELINLVKRTIWFEEPEVALQNKIQFLNYLMTYNNLDDIDIALKYYSLEDFKDALNNALPGIFDVKSWALWHYLLGYNTIPPLPRRKFITEEEYKDLYKWKAKQ